MSLKYRCNWGNCKGLLLGTDIVVALISANEDMHVFQLPFMFYCVSFCLLVNVILKKNGKTNIVITNKNFDACKYGIGYELM